MNNRIFKLCVLVLVLSVFTACQPTPALPAETDTPAPTEVPQAAVISEENASALGMVLNENVGTASVEIHWQADSAAFWLQDLFELKQYDSATAQEMADVNFGEYAAIFDVSPDGSTIAYALGEDGIHLYDTAAQADRLVIPVSFPYSTVFFGPDGNILGVPSMMDLQVIFFDVNSGEETGTISGFSTAAPVYSAKFSPDGKTLLWFARGTVQPQDIATQAMGPILSHEDFVTYEEVSPDGKVIATAAAGTVDGEYTPLLTLWNAVTGDQMAQVPLPNYYTAISFSPDSTLIAASSENSVYIFTSPYGSQVASYDTPEAVTDLAFSSDGKKLLATSDSGSFYLFMVE